MRSSGRLKLGYYPLPESEGRRLRTLLEFAPEGASVLDPCVGSGAALHQITTDAVAWRFGVELDTERARLASEAGISTIHGNIFGANAPSESFSLLYLNPPYDSEIGSYDNKRMEYLFLKHTHKWLVPGGVLIFVIQHAQFESCIPILSSQFKSFQVLRLSDPEAERFDQIVLLAVRKDIRADAQEINRRALVEALYRHPLPLLTGDEQKYSVPCSPPANLTYRGLPLDEIEDLLPFSAAWRKVESCLMPREEVPIERPITPMHAGHVGLLSAAGMLNGVIGNGSERHIARWQTRKYVTTFSETDEKYTEIHRQERFSNEVSLVYEDGRVLVLADKRKGDQDGERPSEAGTA